MSSIKELENIKNMCRICLKRSNNMISLIHKLDDNQDSPSIFAAVESIFSTLINDDLRCPVKVCLMCTGHIRISYNLKMVFEKSEQILQKYISSLKEDYVDSLEDASDLDSWKEENDVMDQSLDSLTEEFLQRDETEDETIEFQEDLQTDEQQETTKMPTEYNKTKFNFSGRILQNISLLGAAPDNQELSNDNVMTMDKPIMLVVEESQMPNEQNEQLTGENDCCYCQERFISKEELAQHLIICRKFELIKCNLCNRKFSSLASKKFHMRMKHSPIVPDIKCEICNQVFKNLQALGYHKRTKHSTKGKVFVCELCGKAFYFRNSLSRHMDTHSKHVSKVVCPICGKSFHYKGGLFYHMKVHTDERNYSCTFCKKRFLNKSALTKHIRRHTGERPYPCKFCDKTFVSTGIRNNHEKTHTGVRSYLCKYCKKGFITLYSLKLHISAHKGSQPCEFCKTTFLNNEALKLHVKFKHKAQGHT